MVVRGIASVRHSFIHLSSRFLLLGIPTSPPAAFPASNAVGRSAPLPFTFEFYMIRSLYSSPSSSPPSFSRMSRYKTVGGGLAVVSIMFLYGTQALKFFLVFFSSAPLQRRRTTVYWSLARPRSCARSARRRRFSLLDNFSRPPPSLRGTTYFFTDPTPNTSRRLHHLVVTSLRGNLLSLEFSVCADR